MALLRSARHSIACAIPLQLHLHVGNTRLVDQFEWDLSNDDTAPEMFAQTLCADLSLGGEYVASNIQGIAT